MYMFNTNIVNHHITFYSVVGQFILILSRLFINLYKPSFFQETLIHTEKSRSLQN